jgi:hypothetical protein
MRCGIAEDVPGLTGRIFRDFQNIGNHTVELRWKPIRFTGSPSRSSIAYTQSRHTTAAV